MNVNILGPNINSKYFSKYLVFIHIDLYEDIRCVVTEVQSCAFRFMEIRNQGITGLESEILFLILLSFEAL